jgi:hypothetical protein
VKWLCHRARDYCFSIPNLPLVLVEQGSSSEVGLVPDVMCGRGGSVTGGVIELDFAQSKAAYLPYAATPTHSVRPCALRSQSQLQNSLLCFAIKTRRARTCMHGGCTDLNLVFWYNMSSCRLWTWAPCRSAVTG